ncbi:MAG: phosphoglucosamine mutase, partial [Actinomycetota bacterium]
ADAVRRAVAETEAALGLDGRVLVRPSGTEPLVRVMVEAESEALASEHAERIAEAVLAASG